MSKNEVVQKEMSQDTKQKINVAISFGLEFSVELGSDTYSLRANKRCPFCRKQYEPPFSI